MLLVEALISRCGHADKAPWLATRREQLENGTPKEKQLALDELAGVIAGMGSLSDLPLSPDPNSRITAMDAQTRLLELLDELYVEIKNLRETASSLTNKDCQASQKVASFDQNQA